MSKHTPGPWFVAYNYGHMTGVRAKNEDIGRWVAQAWCQTSQPTSADAHARQVEQNEANARLIAAAPELLEALQACEMRLTHLAQDSHPVIEELKQARAAIAKATGEAA